MNTTQQGIEVRAPLVNSNEPDACVVEMRVAHGQRVHKGEILCVVETTKAVADVVAEADGYVDNLRVVAGQILHAGDVVCRICHERPTTAAPVPPAIVEQVAELRLTIAARGLAKKLEVDLGKLPHDRIVTEAMVREIAGSGATASQAGTEIPARVLRADQLVIFGGGGHAKTIIDLLAVSKTHTVVGIVDDNIDPVSTRHGVPVLGGREVLPGLIQKGVCLAANAIGAVARLETRVDLFRMLAEQGFGFPRLIHPGALVEPSAKLAEGIQVFGFAFVGAAVQLGFGVIVNTGAILSHDCTVGDCSHIAPGAVLAGEVKVGRGVLVGMGVTTGIGIEIGEGARIGNGARIHDHVPPGTIISAGSSWPR